MERQKKVGSFSFIQKLCICQNTIERKYLCIANNRCKQNCKFQNKISIIPDQVINDIKNIVDGGYKIQQVDYFIKGDEVSVVSGPLKGINGIIQDLKGDSRLIMKVEAIRQAFSIEISSEQLKLKKKNVSKVL